MRLQSIVTPGTTVSFREAVDKGLAEDGGLYMPVVIPRLSDGFFASLHSMTFHEIAFNVARFLLEDEIPDADLRKIVERSITFPAPLRRLDERTSVLELFHGPTLAFKDFGAQFMAHSMAYLHRNDTEERTILVATSGDTGSAVAHGFHNAEGVKVFLLYPSGRVSKIQEQQLTTMTGNVTALEIEGSFDDCQHMVKEAFADKQLSGRRKLTSANSINIARLIPQTFYYFNAIARLSERKGPVVFSVPSGNLGNLTAGLIAWKMGLPADHFIAATNSNDGFTKFLESGVFVAARSVATISNAMDVGNPSNFARIKHLFNGSVKEMRAILSSSSYSDDETRETMVECFRKYNYMLDPHGAVAALALRHRNKSENKFVSGIILETAHPAKFLDSYEDWMKKVIEVPERLRSTLQGTKHSVRLGARFDDLKSFLMSN